MGLWSRFFGRHRKTPELDRRIRDQQRVSEETLEYVEEVLARKDALLAEAVNQTGSGLRKRRRAHA